MGASIGIRIYRFEIRERGVSNYLAFSSPSLSKHPLNFLEQFAQNHSTSNKDHEKERSWYFDRIFIEANNISGFINYGTFGFESKLVDTRTNETNYRRKTTDVEEVPLYFDFWAPKHAKYGLAAFQSFGGRSCIGLVTEKIRDVFERENPNCNIHFRKLMPTSADGGVFSKSEVKKLRFIAKKRPADLADRYSDKPSEPIDMELSLIARRKRNLGTLGSVMSKMPADSSGLIEFNGMEFEEAVAEVKIGKTFRRVGVFGPNGDAGVIDVSENVERGFDGHPTHETIARETTSLIGAFHSIIKDGAK